MEPGTGFAPEVNVPKNISTVTPYMGSELPHKECFLKKKQKKNYLSVLFVRCFLVAAKV